MRRSRIGRVEGRETRIYSVVFRFVAQGKGGHSPRNSRSALFEALSRIDAALADV